MECKEGISCKVLCMACLCAGRKLRVVTDEKLKQYYLDALDEILLGDIATAFPIVCWECEALLRKAVSFWEQVQDSYRILQTYSNENLHECILTDVTRPPRLKIITNDSITITPSRDYDDVKLREMQLICVKDEVKNDWDDDHDVEVPVLEDCAVSDCMENVPELKTGLQMLITGKKKSKNSIKSKVKRAKKIVKRLEISKKQEKPKATNKNYTTIELSHEEMLLERERDAAKESYLKAEFKCDTCIVGFNYSRSYEAHVAGKHAPNIGDYICPICKTIIGSVESFTTHYKRHMRRFECRICEKRTLDRARIKQHMYSAHDITVSSNKCKQCGHVSHSIDSHIHHLDTHKGRFKCPDCVKSFKHRGGLKNHIIAVHELNNNFPCHVCGKVFRWKNSLKRHVEKHDSNDRSPEAAFCDSCGIGFKSICSYQRHLKNSLKHVSQDQRKYVCDHCNRRFIDKTKLRDHIEDKHLHKTYQCHICLKSSKNRVNLDQHIRNVHKGRPNNKMCHHCGKVFPTKVQLESHMRTHTGERPFTCDYCPTTFTQKSNLYKHYRQVHLNIKSKRYPFKKHKEENNQPESVASNQQPLVDPYKPIAVVQYSPERGFVM